MPAVTLKQQVQPIAKAAIVATFQGQIDKNNIADKFAKKFAEGFANAIYSYVGMCTVLPTGGPVTAATTSKLQQDLIQTAKDAFIAMFQNEQDKNNIADKFSKPFGNFAASMVTYMQTCLSILGTPPTMITPGGVLITVPSTVCVLSMYQVSYQGMTASFQGESDDMQLAKLFATQMQNIGNFIQSYISTCIAPAGGGTIIAK